MDNIKYFISLFPSSLKVIFEKLEIEILETITEIRLRKNQPVIIYLNNKSGFISLSGRITSVYNPCCIKLNDEDFNYIVGKLCNNSFHTNINSMLQGYITTENGSRVGIGFNAVIKDGKAVSVSNITSLNIRIAKPCEGCSKEIIDLICKNSTPSIIVAGKPSSGKTTFLRDYAKQLSNGYTGDYKKISVIDERCELSSGFDLGINTDSILSLPKAKGIELATRALSPDIIICDEIAGIEELQAIEYAFNCGIRFAVSVHLSSIDEINSNKLVQKIKKSNSFDYIILLKSYTDDYEIISLREDFYESSRNYNDNSIYFFSRTPHKLLQSGAE